MGKFNYLSSDFILRRNDVFFRLIDSENKSISNLLLYRKKQNSIKEWFDITRKKSIRRKSFKGKIYLLKRNSKRVKVKKDILDWSYRKIPLT